MVVSLTHLFSTLIAENAAADKEEHLLSLTAGFIVTIFWYQLISALVPIPIPMPFICV
jgi:hypothetical protein